MKKFILHCIALFCFIIVTWTGLLSFSIITTKYFTWKIPENKTTLFMGASHIAHAIDDSLLEGAMNLSDPSERYPFTYLKLKKILTDGNKIEHIILECAPTDLSKVADKKIFDAYNEMIAYIPLYYALFGKNEWIIYTDYIPNIFSILSSHFYTTWTLSPNKHFSKYGGFKPLKEVFDKKSFLEKKIKQVDADYYGNSVNLSYLKKIIELCQLNNIRLTLLYCPMYKPELYYDQAYYYNILNMEFGNIEYLNYNNLDIPDNYRADSHHLNSRGAIYFTKTIAERLGLTYKNIDDFEK